MSKEAVDRGGHKWGGGAPILLANSAGQNLDETPVLARKIFIKQVLEEVRMSLDSHLLEVPYTN